MKKRTAFTLVEILATIAIIGLLIGLLLPAVQSARESARRTQCASRIRDFALALQQYHESNNVFPPGNLHAVTNTSLSPPTLACDETALSYSGTHSYVSTPMNHVVAILPFVEQKAAYDSLDITKAANVSPNKEVTSRSYPFVLCPTHPIQQYTDSYRSMQHFGGSAGSQRPAPRVMVCGPTSPGLGGTPPQASLKPDGLFWGNSRTSMAWIRDGSSRTIMVCERMGYTPAAGFGNPGSAAFFDVVSINGLASFTIAMPGFGPNKTGNASTWNDAYAFHPGGLNVAMADGSVTFASEGTDLTTWQQLLSRNDGQPLTDGI